MPQYGPVTEKTVKATGEKVQVRQNLETGKWETAAPEAGFAAALSGAKIEAPRDPSIVSRFKKGFASSPEQIAHIEQQDPTSPGPRESTFSNIPLGFSPTTGTRSISLPVGGIAELIGSIPEMAGQYGAEALALALTKSPWSIPPASAFGSAVGSGVKRAVGEHVLGLPPVSGTEAATDTALSGAAGLVTSLPGTAILKTSGRLKKNVSPSGVYAEDFLRTVLPDSDTAKLTLGQAVDSRGWNILENIGEGGFLGTHLTRTKHTAQMEVTKAVDNMVRAFGDEPAKDALGYKAMQAIDKSFTDFIAPAVDIRENQIIPVAEQAGIKVPVGSVSRLVKFLQKETLGARELGSRSPSALSATGLLKRTPKEVEEGIEKEITVPEAIHARTLVGHIMQEASRRGDHATAQVAKTLYNRVDSSLNKVMKENGLDGLWAESNRIFREGYSKFYPDLLDSTIKNAQVAPERFVTAMTGADRLTLINQIKGALVDTPQWGQLQQSIMRDLYTRSLQEPITPLSERVATFFMRGIPAKHLEPKGPVLSGQKLANNAFGPEGYGKEFLERALGKDQVDFLGRLHNTLDRMQTSPTGIGSAAIQFAQVGAGMGLVSGLTGMFSDNPTLNGVQMGGGAIILGPAAIAKISTSPAARKYLLEGLQTPAGTAAATNLISRLLVELGRNATGEELQPGTTVKLEDTPAGYPTRTPPPPNSRLPFGLPQLEDLKPRTNPSNFIHNPDGSVSSELSITIEDEGINGGKPTNIPSIFNGKIVTPDEAIERIIAAGGKDPETGRKLPAYNSVAEAVKAAQERTHSLGRGN